MSSRQEILGSIRQQPDVTVLISRPTLNPAIVCTATYYDAWVTHPERLCLELVLDSEAMLLQARALNYVAVQSAVGSTVTLRDEVSGESFAVKPKVFVNATGAWIDFTNRRSSGKRTS